MFTPIYCFIGLRYTRAKKRNYFVSFISLSSMLGIALGVMVLITVLSVMNGFDSEIHRRFFGMAPEITITHRDGALNDWQALQKALIKIKDVKFVSPYVGSQGLMSFQGQVMPVAITGIRSPDENIMSGLNKKMLIGDLKNLTHFGIILGRNIATQLGVIKDDLITIMIPEATVTPAGVIPRFKRFTLRGIFSAGNGFNFDNRLAFIDLKDAQNLMHLGNAVTGVKLRLKEPYAAPKLAEELQIKLGEDYEVSSWADQFGPFFHAVKMEKTMMFFILLLIIAVAVFNLVSSLVMIVNDKQAEIAILRTMGATPKNILRIFIVQGMLIGTAGIIMGLFSGILLAKNATQIVEIIQRWFHTQFLSSNIYFVDFLPSKIMLSDLIEICCIALLMCFVATLYPAWQASRTMIAEALHHE